MGVRWGCGEERGGGVGEKVREGRETGGEEEA